ncbi:MAG TPA: alanine--tRNA ligase-related protein, partial [Spirochaetota bacterium]|nr:alanine--tRNA ligase-related protein [Spirochaetota bacterium]
MLQVKDLRDSFIDFFREHNHKIVPSSPLIPKDDPTLLFTTAGMVQFKPMFAGTVDLEYTRAASIQKCLRTSDLENVGKTKRHCT